MSENATTVSNWGGEPYDIKAALKKALAHMESKNGLPPVPNKLFITNAAWDKLSLHIVPEHDGKATKSLLGLRVHTFAKASDIAIELVGMERDDRNRTICIDLSPSGNLRQVCNPVLAKLENVTVSE
jgi:hypothetical protein